MIQLKIDESFYEPEIRSGYFVSAEMKKIWAVELDLLAKFIDVCERYGLCYFADGGTLLGAVRHKGFIPWDDDVDVMMPRKDYNKLFEIASQEFQYPYFFQNTLTENGFFRTHAQLRNSSTTGFIEIDSKKDINRGIFLDIFPLDGVPDSRVKQWMLKKRIETEKKILAYEYDRDYEQLPLKGKINYKLVHAFFKVISFKKFFNRFNQKTLAKYSQKPTRLVGDLSLKWRENVHWKAEWFDGYVLLQFEKLQIRVPLFYKEVLAHQYGDFMRLPADVKAANGRSHGNVTFDPEVPYTEYVKDKKRMTKD